MTRRHEVRVEEEEYVLTIGQAYWIRVNDHRDLTGATITAVLWKSWADRTPQDGGETLQIRSTLEQLAEGIFWVGSPAFVLGGVAHLNLSSPTEVPTVTPGLDVDQAGTVTFDAVDTTGTTQLLGPGPFGDLVTYTVVEALDGQIIGSPALGPPITRAAFRFTTRAGGGRQ